MEGFTQVQEDVEHHFVYVFVRKDLSQAQICVQSCHAAMESARNYLSRTDEHPSVIIFGIKNEAKLRSIADIISQSGIPIKHFFEPDIGNQLTAIASAPVKGSDREIFSKYCLLK